jgi:GT2 family glycosyltransferase
VEKVSVVIPNWNGKKWLKPCLESLRHQSFTDFSTYVVDNGSTDGSVAYLREHFPEIRVVALPDNRGFAAAMNAGIEASTGDYVAALNNDTEVDRLWLEALVGTLDQRPDVGLCASKILHFDDRSIIDSVGDSYTRTGFAFKLGAHERDEGQFQGVFDVFGACAAAAIYRRSMLADIGLFDEDFFCYMEDVDLCIRARLAGYRCVSVSAAIVYHIGSATTGGSASAFSIRMTTKNIYNILFKDIPMPLLPMMLILTIAAQAGAIILSFVTPRYPWLRRNLRAYFSGLAAALRQAPTMLRKRRQLRRLKRIPTAEFMKTIVAAEDRIRVSRRRLAHST